MATTDFPFPPRSLSSPLSDEQVAHFTREGYLVLPNFFSEEEVSERRQALSKQLLMFVDDDVDNDRGEANGDQEDCHDDEGSGGGESREGSAGDDGDKDLADSQSTADESWGALVGFDPWDMADRDAGGPGLRGDALNPGRVTFLGDIHRADGVFERHMRNPKLLQTVAALLGNDVDAFQSACIIKPPCSNMEYHGWHQDILDYGSHEGSYGGMTNFGHLNTITYLAYCAAGNGSTVVAPRSHRMADGGEGPVRTRQYLQRAPGLDPPDVKQRTLEGLDELLPTAVAPSFAPGDVMIMDSWLAHRVDSNASNVSMPGLINVYCRPDCRPKNPGARQSEIEGGGPCVPVLRDGVVLCEEVV